MVPDGANRTTAAMERRRLQYGRLVAGAAVPSPVIT
jgi:hypothetical protein